jgi:hypothetical protein
VDRFLEDPVAAGALDPFADDLAAGVVDLGTGDVQWMSFDSSASMDSRKADDIDALVRDFYRTWPGQK